MKVLLGGDYFYDLSSRRDDFGKIIDSFEKYDLVILNFEGSMRGEDSEITRKSIRLSVSEESFRLPNNTILSLANNHISDFGQGGIRNTIHELEKNNLKYFGLTGAINFDENHLIYEKDGIKICLIGFGWKNEECIPPSENKAGVLDFNKKNIDSTFEKIKDLEFDQLIAYIHNGYEFEYYPLPLHVGLSRYLVDKGCDFIFASHTHCIQPYEIYKDRHIFYGLGNFYFTQMRNKYPEFCDLGLALEIEIDKTNINVIGALSVKYNRQNNQTTISKNKEFLKDEYLPFTDLLSYSRNYKNIRTRKVNPRPIYFYEADLVNSIKYNLWLAIVKITGFLGIRSHIKKLLGWN